MVKLCPTPFMAVLCMTRQFQKCHSGKAALCSNMTGLPGTGALIPLSVTKLTQNLEQRELLCDLVVKETLAPRIEL